MHTVSPLGDIDGRNYAMNDALNQYATLSCLEELR